MSRVLIVMGSDSDLPVMGAAAEALTELGVGYELRILSAHRTPNLLWEEGKSAHTEGFDVVIAGAGGAAHLPGMFASLTPLPVIGVPVRSHNSIQGVDSLLSIVQMPGGVPVATVAINGAKNAGILAAQILSVGDADLRARIIAMKDGLRDKVIAKREKVAAEHGQG